MTQREANEKYEKLTYDLAKEVARLNEIKIQMDYVNEAMGYDGMFMVDFSEAMERLANVESASIIYTLEEKYRKSDIQNHQNMIEALKQ